MTTRLTELAIQLSVNEQLILGDGELNYKILLVLSIEGYNLMQLESVYENVN